jgi:hypothetical protein
MPTPDSGIESAALPATESQPRKLRILHWLSAKLGIGRGALLLILGTVMILLATGASVGASRLEENDVFCTTCHLAPERTYYNRAQFALDHQEQPIPDLATFHYVMVFDNMMVEEFRCVDCHRGRQTVTDRSWALAIGAYDGLVYALGGGSTSDIERGNVHQPRLIETACTNCHQETLLILGFDNHFHNYLPAAEREQKRTGDLFVPEGISFEDEQKLLKDGLLTKSTQVNCLTCHKAHVSIIGGERVKFIDDQTNLRGCTQCHEDNDLNIDLLQPTEAEEDGTPETDS